MTVLKCKTWLLILIFARFICICIFFNVDKNHTTRSWVFSACLCITALLKRKVKKWSNNYDRTFLTFVCRFNFVCFLRCSLPWPALRLLNVAQWCASSCLCSWWPAGCRRCWRTCWGWRRCGSQSFSPAPRSPGSRSGSVAVGETKGWKLWCLNQYRHHVSIFADISEDVEEPLQFMARSLWTKVDKQNCDKNVLQVLVDKLVMTWSQKNVANMQRCKQLLRGQGVILASMLACLQNLKYLTNDLKWRNVHLHKTACTIQIYVDFNKSPP